MPDLVLKNLPNDLYESLQRRADERHRALPEEVVQLLREVVEGHPDGRLPEFTPGEEVSPPCDLPRSSQPTLVEAIPQEERLPDPPMVGESDNV